MKKELTILSLFLFSLGWLPAKADPIATFGIGVLTASAGDDLLQNGDFADGLSPWNGSDVAPAVGDASVTGGELYFNVINDDGVNWHLRIGQGGLNLKNGSSYRLQFNARAHSSRTLRANVKAPVAGDLANFDVTLGTSMQTYTRDFTMPHPTEENVRLTFYFGAAGDNDVWVDNVSIVELAPDSDPYWIPQGSLISLNPTLSGTVYLIKYRIPYQNYKDGSGNFSESELAAYAAVAQSVVAGQSYTIDTGGMLPGTYDLVLVDNGVVETTHQFHMAFHELPYSPHYEVSVQVNSQSRDLATYYSYRQPEYIRDWNVDGQGVIDIVTGYNEPVNAHSWAGISTDDYPITVRVKVLPAAQQPYYDGASGITLPLSSAHVLPSSYGIPCSIENGDTIVFTLDRAEKVLVIPNYNEAMAVFTSLAVGHTPLSSFENIYTSGTIPPDFNADRASQQVSEGYKNPLVFLGRSADTFAEDLDFAKNDTDTLVVQPGDRPTQTELSAATVVWFEPGAHDLSRLGVHPSYRTYINAGQVFYLEEGAFVAAGFKKDEATGHENCHLVGRGLVTGINHFWGGGTYEMNSLAAEVDIVDGLDFVDRAQWGIDGGDMIRDIALLGAWHGNCDGVDSLDHCTVLDSLLMAHDDNLKLNDHTYAEDIVIYMLGTNAHPIMFKEMWDDVVFANTVVRDVDVIGYWKHSSPNQEGWHRITPGAIACMQTRNVFIENAYFNDIRIESPHLSRVFSFYNLYSEGLVWPYIPSWLGIDNRASHSRINGLVFENITVNSPLIGWRSLLGSGFADSFTNVSFANIYINGDRVSEANKDQYFEISGYVNGTDPVDGGSPRINIPDPVTNLVFHDTLYASWYARHALTLGLEGDEDGDNVANVLEFALGGDPWNPGSAGTSPYMRFQGGQLNFVYPVLRWPNTGLTYSVERSSNLVGWEPDSGVPQLLGESGEFEFYGIPIPLDDLSARFYRLRVEQ